MKMKKIFSAFLVLAITLSAFSLNSFAAGYTQIKTAEDLELIRDNLSGNYILMNDIVFDGDTTFSPIGSSSNKFSGTFDGNDHVISNIILENGTDENSSYIGFFAVNGGTVKNLSIKNASVKVNDCSYLYFGIIAASSQRGTVDNCYTSGDIEAENFSTSANVGGIIGVISSGNVKNSFSDANITYSDVKTITAGGITAENNGSVLGCNFGGTIDVYSMNTAVSGGIVGANSGSKSIKATVKNCCFLGSIISECPNTSFCGGIVGRDKSGLNGSVSYCIVGGEMSAKAGGIMSSETAATVYWGSVCGSFKGESSDNYVLSGIAKGFCANGTVSAAFASLEEMRATFSLNPDWVVPKDETVFPHVATLSIVSDIKFISDSQYVELSEPMNYKVYFDDGNYLENSAYCTHTGNEKIHLDYKNKEIERDVFCYLSGDANGDSRQTVTDILLINEYILSGTTPDGLQLLVTDLDKNSTINVTDITLLIDIIMDTSLMDLK